MLPEDWDRPSERRSMQYLIANFVLYANDENWIGARDDEDEPKSLLDIFYWWLEYDDGYAWCHTYEMLLRLIIEVADDLYTGHNRLGLHFCRPDEQGAKPYEIIECLVRRPAERDASYFSHPVLDKAEFEHGLARARLKLDYPKLFWTRGQIENEQDD